MKEWDLGHYEIRQGKKEWIPPKIKTVDEVEHCEDLLVNLGYKVEPPRRITERMACIAVTSRGKSLHERKLAMLHCDATDETTNYRQKYLEFLEEDLKERPDDWKLQSKIARLKKDLKR